MRRSLIMLASGLLLASALVVVSGPASQPRALAQTTGGAAQEQAAPPPVVSPPLNAQGAYDPSNTLVLYGDMALFSGRSNPESCTLKNRYKRGEPVGFRMTAIEPASGAFAETAELVVRIPLPDRIEALPMRYRGTGDGARPGFWTVKWVVPDDTPTGVIRYTVEAQDKEGRTGIWAPYNIETSMLTIVE
ncbi:MAG: hypothetical protein IT307_10555 [Chloroflexi bacterium]|nr:hypothetical protein [Chloroflexota bacterium]